jgi:hypothetical protein
MSNLEASTNHLNWKFKAIVVSEHPKLFRISDFEIRIFGGYAADTGGALAGLRKEAITSGRIRSLSSSDTGVNFDSPFG